ncbi:hypothetical protein, partial [Oxynema sp. CENA135]
MIAENFTNYNLIWNCAENLLYPPFYQAWHNPASSSSPTANIPPRNSSPS